MEINETRTEEQSSRDNKGTMEQPPDDGVMTADCMLRASRLSAGWSRVEFNQAEKES